MVTLKSNSLSSLVMDVVRPETTNSNPNSPTSTSTSTSTSTPLMVRRRKVERIFPVYARGKLSPRSDSAVNWGSVVGDSIWDDVRVEANCQCGTGAFLEAFDGGAVDHSQYLVAEACTPSCEAVDLSQSSFYLHDSLNQSMANYSLDDENTNDSPTMEIDYEEEFSYSFELSDDEIGKRLNQMASLSHVPKVNGEFPSLDEASLDHQRLQLYQLVESKVRGDGNWQAAAELSEFKRH
ncbi:hypothetical protein L2E82_30595 [Cichorium intybus]|uniref:Uncharacterized protein n=1 Tax=Cichorium intybus TaxID=13427 RepID=A0ACB9D141_CICIN|nr:hypothetical protein L2E82_30595 [Cichorium intybus]